MLEIAPTRRELLLAGLAATAVALVLFAGGAAADSAAPPAGTSGGRALSDDEILRRFVALPDEPTRSFRVRRHLEITSGALGKTAWLDVLVELDAGQGFRYTVTGAGGSEMLRDKILHKVLRAEQEVYTAGTNDRTALTVRNYQFAACGRTAEGLVCLRATARRREVGLLDGRFLVSPDTADLVEVSGTMAKGPSFWIPRVDMSKRYARIQGHRVNVRVDSVSHVRLLGESRFTMTSVYERIDGEAIVSSVALARPGHGHDPQAP